MASIADTKAIIAKTNGSTDIRSVIKKSVKELGRVLPAHMNPERLARIALTNIRLVPELQKCTPESFLGALFTAAQIGIEPIAGRAYILPYNNNRKQPDGSWRIVKEAQFMIGYKGMAELFYRHEKAVQLDWAEVHANDEFDYEYGTEAFLKHKPALKDRGEVTMYWAMAKLQNGGKPFMVMSKDDCMEHGRKHSKTFDKKSGQFFDKSPWATNPDAMCLKTVLIQLAKLLPLSVELQRAIAADETSREYRAGIEDALDTPPTNNWDDDPIESEAVPPADTAKKSDDIEFGE